MAAGLKKVPAKRSPYAVGATGVTFTIGAETTSRTISMQFLGAGGSLVFLAYLSSDAAGDTLLGTAPTGTVVAGTNGTLLQDIGTAKKIFLLKSEAAGTMDLVITEAGAKDMYLNVVMPDGTVVTSSIISFAA